MEFTGLVLPALDPERQSHFYAALLGPLARVLEFAPVDPAGTLHLAFDVPENRLAESLALVERRTAVIEPAVDHSAWHAHAYYFEDPEGNVLEGIARHRLSNAAAEPRFLNVSEVGLPVDDVPATVEWLASTLGVSLFSGGGESFAAVGDDRGLLIVVPHGRDWFPTHRPAGRGPLVVRLAGEPAGEWEVPGSRGVRIERGA